MKKNWYDDEKDGLTPEAYAVIESLAVGVKEEEVAEDIEVESAIIQQWLADPGFVAEVESSKRKKKASIRQDILVKIRNGEWDSLSFKVETFDVSLGLYDTEKQRLAYIEEYVIAIREAMLKASIPVDKKTMKALNEEVKKQRYLKRHGSLPIDDEAREALIEKAKDAAFLEKYGYIPTDEEARKVLFEEMRRI